MPTFDAGSVAEPLDYDFTTVRGFKDKRAKGTIPEPTDDQIADFIGAIRDMMKEAGSIAGAGQIDVTNPSTFFNQLDAYDPEKFRGVFHGMTKAYSELCSGHPSVEQIAALPLRIRLRFFAWVQEEVVSPEVGTGGGIAVVTPLRPAAAG